MRADERDLVHDLGDLGQLLADLDAAALGGDRLVRPADALGRVRLHVEHVDVARPAALEEEDDGFRADRRRGGGFVFLGRQQARERKAEQAESADLQGAAARELDAIETVASEGRHVTPLRDVVNLLNHGGTETQR